jgi:hypothetical protein
VQPCNGERDEKKTAARGQANFSPMELHLLAESTHHVELLSVVV